MCDLKILWFVLLILIVRMSYLTIYSTSSDLPYKDASILAIFCIVPTFEMWLYGSWFEEGPTARKDLKGWAGPVVSALIAIPATIFLHLI
jgi:hypothetical protein